MVTPAKSARRENASYALALHRHLNIIDKWLNPEHVRLQAGEMTAQEMRSVMAVLRAVRYEIERG